MEVMTWNLSPALLGWTFILCVHWSDSGSLGMRYYLVLVSHGSVSVSLYNCSDNECDVY